MSEEKIVDLRMDYVVEVKVTKKIHAVINPNGRGYESDNKTHKEEVVLLHSSVKARDITAVQDKTAAILSVLDDDQAVRAGN